MKIICTSFSLLVLAFFINTSSSMAQTIEASFQVTQEGTINIYYKFKGDPGKDYDVTVILKRKSDPTFSLIPKNVSGSVGVGKFANAKRTIIWELTSSEQQSLKGNDYYFAVNAKPVEAEKGGGIPWYVYVGGAALAGGTAAILLLKKNGNSNSGSNASIPDPPGRPQ